MSASTTSTVGRRMRCFARSRRRDGTVTRTPRRTSAETRCRPTKPDPPRTRTFPNLILGSFGQLVLSRLGAAARRDGAQARPERHQDRKSTRLNSSHHIISYSVFFLKKKKKKYN